MCASSVQDDPIISPPLSTRPGSVNWQKVRSWVDEGAQIVYGRVHLATSPRMPPMLKRRRSRTRQPRELGKGGSPRTNAFCTNYLRTVCVFCGVWQVRSPIHPFFRVWIRRERLHNVTHAE